MTSKTARDLGDSFSAVVKRHELFAFEWCKMSIGSHRSPRNMVVVVNIILLESMRLCLLLSSVALRLYI